MSISSKRLLGAVDALHGDAPLDCLTKFLLDAKAHLRTSRCRAGQANRCTEEEPTADCDSRQIELVLGKLAATLDPAGKSEMCLKLSQRRPGNKGNGPFGGKRRERELRAIHLVLSLTAEGWKQTAAIHEAVSLTGVSRSRIYEALGRWRGQHHPISDAVLASFSPQIDE